MTKDEEIRIINEKLDFYVMEVSDEEALKDFWISPNCAKRVCWRKGYEMKIQLIDFGVRSKKISLINQIWKKLKHKNRCTIT